MRRTHSRSADRPARMPSRRSAAPRHWDTARQARAHRSGTPATGTPRTPRQAPPRCPAAPAAGTARYRRRIPPSLSGCAAGTPPRPAPGWPPQPWRRGRGGRAASSGTVTDSQSRHLREDRIPVERRRRHHHRLARARHRVQHLQDHTRRALTDDHLLVAHPDVLGDQRAQPFGQILRIAVGGVDRFDQRGAHRGQRRERILVERQRERIDRLG